MLNPHRLAAIVLAGALVPQAVRADDPKPPAGFTALFNGKDLAGWQGNTDMKQRATMPKEKLDALLKQRTKTALEHWSVKDGAIVLDGKGGVSLQTVKDYGNFELLLDWKIEKNGDSGIYLRGQPQVQIWDSDNSPGARSGQAFRFRRALEQSAAPGCGPEEYRQDAPQEGRQAPGRVEQFPDHHEG